jgi:hypothetical protein
MSLKSWLKKLPVGFTLHGGPHFYNSYEAKKLERLEARQWKGRKR